MVGDRIKKLPPPPYNISLYYGANVSTSVYKDIEKPQPSRCSTCQGILSTLCSTIQWQKNSWLGRQYSCWRRYFCGQSGVRRRTMAPRCTSLTRQSCRAWPQCPWPGGWQGAGRWSRSGTPKGAKTTDHLSCQGVCTPAPLPPAVLQRGTLDGFSIQHKVTPQGASLNCTWYLPQALEESSVWGKI